MAKFGVHLLQQVQILLLEYLGRIQQKHMEEMKWDHFYEGINPKYQHMLAHKVGGEHPASYSTWSLQHRNWKDGQKLEIPCTQRPP